MREGAGLTVRQVAEAANVPASTLGGYFSGRHLPPVSQPHVLTGILRACGVEEVETVNAWRIALSRVRRAPGPRPAGVSAPYRGLASFQPEDSEWFFGRREPALLVRTRLELGWATGAGPVAVIGPSGSGKSSLLRAGVVPVVHDGGTGIRHSRNWPVLLFSPGARPIDMLAAQLADLTDVDAAGLAAELRERPERLAHHARHAATLASGSAVLIVVDQLEEVFTETTDAAERHAFLAALQAASTSTAARDGSGTNHERPPAAVLLGLRADFYQQALHAPQLLPVLQKSQVAVGPMTEAELREAIVEPARKAGLDIEDGLVEIILRDVKGSTRPADASAHDPGALPLLSHALLATWERSPAGRLTVAAYTAAGGIDGSVARTADSLIDSLTPREQEAARQLLVRLVRVGEGVAHTRRRVDRSELEPSNRPGRTGKELSSVLDRLAAARLVTTDVATVELTHESLVAAWPRLRSWIDADRRALLTGQQLADAAQQWDGEGRDPDLLYRGGRLAAAREWVASGGRPGPLAAAFLQASVGRERRRVRTLYEVIAGLAVLLVLAVAGGAYAYHLRGEAEAARIVATGERNAALSRMVAIRADRLYETDPALAQQLALVAYQTAPTVEARSSLLSSSSGPAVTRMLGPDGIIQSVAVSPDGGIVAGAGADGSVRLWAMPDAASPDGMASIRELTDSLPGLDGVVNSLAFHPDGRVLAAAGTDRSVYLYDVADPARPVTLGAPLTEPDGDLHGLAFSPDGSMLAAGGLDESVWLWDVDDPSRPALLGEPLAAPSASVASVTFSPDGRLLAAGGHDRMVHLWDLAEPTSPATIGDPLTGPELSVFDVTFSPDGSLLAAASTDRNVYLWDVGDPMNPGPLPPLTGPSSWVHTVTFSPDGRAVAAGSSDGLLWMWDQKSGETIATLPHPGPVTDAVFQTDGRGLYTGAADGAVRRWQLPGPVLAAATDAVHEVAYHPDRPVVAMASGDGHVYLWDVGDPARPAMLGDPVASPDDDSYLVGAAVFSPDGATLVSAGLDGTVWRWDVGDLEAPVLLDPPLRDLSTFAERLAFSPDGRLLAGGAADGTVALWDVSDLDRPAPLAMMAESTLNVLAVAFSPDGRTLAAGGVDSVVWLWDVSDPRNPVRHAEPLRGPTNSVYWLTFGSDGDTLAVGSADGTARLWDVSDPGRPQAGAVLSGPDGYIVGLALSPDGDRLAAASHDHAVWMWDISDSEDPELEAVLAGANGGLHAVSFDHAGDTLVAAGQDPTGRIWHVEADLVAARVCATSGDPVTEEEWAKHVPGLPYHPPC